MVVTKTETLPVRSEQDIVLARQTVRRLATAATFGLVDQTKIVTAASELARNTLVYGGGGELVCELLADGGKKGLRLTFTDQGPGISDMDLAMKDGWTSGHGMGLGLSGSKRLVNEFDIESSDKGTKVTVARWK